MPCLALPCPAVPHPAPPCFAFIFALICPASPRPALLFLLRPCCHLRSPVLFTCPALPCPALPCPALPCLPAAPLRLLLCHAIAVIAATRFTSHPASASGGQFNGFTCLTSHNPPPPPPTPAKPTVTFFANKLLFQPMQMCCFLLQV